MPRRHRVVAATGVERVLVRVLTQRAVHDTGGVFKWVTTVVVSVALAGTGLAWWGVATTSAPWADSLFFTVIGGVTVVLGLMIARRVASNPVGLLLTLVGASQLALVMRDAWLWVSFERPEQLAQPSAFVLAALGTVGAVTFLLVGLLLFVFPSGRLPSPRWRWAVAVLVAATGLLLVGGPFGGDPPFPPYQDRTPWVAHPGAVERVLSVGAVVLFMGALLMTAVLVIVRVRRARGTERLQLRWVLLGTALLLFYPIVCGSEILLAGSPGNVSLAVAYLGMVALPVGLATGMLRHDLFDVDRALASVITWVIVATGLGLVFGLVLTVAGATLGQGSPWAAAAATAGCAVVLLPGYRAVSQWVGRRLYPLRRAALSAIEAVEQRLNVGGAPEGLEDALRTAVRDPALRIGYVVPETGETVDVAGASVADPASTPIEAGGERIGVLVAPSLTPALRREIAARSVMLVNVVRLRLDLQRTVAEVEASRARLVEAEDAARRRFERDLHDGAQQRLVALGLSLRLAQRRAAAGDADLTGTLDQAVAELSTAVAELRRLAHGIRPSVLDDGLGPALGSLARLVPVQVAVAVDPDVDLAPLPEPVAATAYFVAAEALANAVKHSDAGSISLRAQRAGGMVSVEVRDDGRGGANAAGSGLRGLGDRVAAVGGRLRLSSIPGRGTCVEAVLPCG